MRLALLRRRKRGSTVRVRSEGWVEKAMQGPEARVDFQHLLLEGPEISWGSEQGAPEKAAAVGWWSPTHPRPGGQMAPLWLPRYRGRWLLGRLRPHGGQGLPFLGPLTRPKDGVTQRPGRLTPGLLLRGPLSGRPHLGSCAHPVSSEAKRGPISRWYPGPLRGQGKAGPAPGVSSAPAAPLGTSPTGQTAPLTRAAPRRDCSFQRIVVLKGDGLALLADGVRTRQRQAQDWPRRTSVDLGGGPAVWSAPRGGGWRRFPQSGDPDVVRRGRCWPRPSPSLLRHCAGVPVATRRQEGRGCRDASVAVGAGHAVRPPQGSAGAAGRSSRDRRFCAPSAAPRTRACPPAPGGHEAPELTAALVAAGSLAPSRTETRLSWYRRIRPSLYREHWTGPPGLRTPPPQPAESWAHLGPRKPSGQLPAGPGARPPRVGHASCLPRASRVAAHVSPP
ncbi:uncharacterized protein LOC122230751 [Panthera tigris]|uniref:uncharacterized protein LOC122230751 n=1 Tax=Panthera tigris TaxID=9694 RepID=UPI001C6F7507|nr:uncharacterized protein LOC122230751 [Panthera tigris]